MDQANQILEGEYAKRVWLDTLDQKNFLSFVEPYRTGSKVDFEGIAKDGKLPEYHLLAYLTTASHLGKLLLENFIEEHSDMGQKSKEKMAVDWEQQFTKLEDLKRKAGLNEETGGLIDETEPINKGDKMQRCNLVIGDRLINVTGKSTREQARIYEEELEKAVTDAFSEDKTYREKVVGLVECCDRLYTNQSTINKVVKSELESKRNLQKENHNYQKKLTQE